MKKRIYTLLWTACLTVMFVTSLHAAPSAKVTAKVVDENGTPIQGANVTAGYTLAKKGGWGTTDYREKGKSDKDGLFTATGETIVPQVTIHAEHEGYYRSSKWAEFKSSSLLLNRWEPWNPTIEVLLKKKRNPVPMYRRFFEALPIPAFKIPVGFDLEKGAWVAPYGNGLVSDLVFTCDNDYKSFSDARTSCNITFSNQLDGAQEFRFDPKDQSLYRWPYEAPENGYDMKHLGKWMSVSPNEEYKSNYKDKLNYLFRVRSVVDKNGKLVKANYGKIEGDIRVYKKGEVNFTYFFNPDGTRNLEEDPDKNLFKTK